MMSAIFVDVSGNYFVQTIIQPMLNIFVKFRANILGCYLILARLCGPNQVQIHEKWLN